SQAAQMAGVGEVTSRQFPAVPSRIRELHLATIPKSGSQSSARVSSQNNVQRIHQEVEQAVAAALQTAYQRLPIPELLEAIQNGHPITRVAALASGGGRLPDENLDILLSYADDDDPKYQRAALVALRHFGDPRALDKLLQYTRKNVKPLSTVATQSLAASRYDAAHHALLEILKNEAPESKKSIVQILSQHPRAIWSETIYEFANDPGSEIVVDALTALARVGHPQLHDLLVRSLNQTSNAKMRQVAFQLLVNRQTTQSDEVALGYTLNHLKTKAPDSQMIRLLTRTKDSRAVPLLIKQLNQGGNSGRSALIGCLTQIGDESVIDLFVEKYTTFESSEQTTILNALRQMKSPRFRDLAQKALMSNNSSLVSTACQGLQVDGSESAVQMLVKALEVSGSSSTWSYTCNALGQIGTPVAQAALRKARSTGNSSKSRYAASALRSIQQRSPGYQYIYHAKNLEKQKKWDEALKLYTEAIGIDDALPDAFAGRAHVLLKQEKYGDSLKDFERALKIDPYHSLATSGKGIALVMSGKYQDGIKVVEDVRSRFQSDSVFAYNTACVYGRALEYVTKTADLPGRDEKLVSYKDMVIQELKRSLKLGFTQMELMKADPDLASVHKTPEFQALLIPGKSSKGARGPQRIRPKL
ncbi:MAG: HEAT repeat domain-containing protein, partial [Planctomycetaceae bacterium]